MYYTRTRSHVALDRDSTGRRSGRKFVRSYILKYNDLNHLILETGLISMMGIAFYIISYTPALEVRFGSLPHPLLLSLDYPEEGEQERQAGAANDESRETPHQ